MPVSVFCIQDGSKIEELIEDYNATIVKHNGLITLGDSKSVEIVDVYAKSAIVSKFEGYTVININLNKNNFHSQSASNLKHIAKEVFKELKRLIKSLEDENIFVVGNLGILNDFPGWTKRKDVSHLFKKLNFDYVYNDNNYIAYKGEAPEVYLIESKELGSDQDWMVANFK